MAAARESASRKGLAIVALVVVLALVAAIVAFFVLRKDDGAKTSTVHATTTPSISTTAKADNGFYDDGWVRRVAHKILPAGPAGALTLSGEVTASHQSVTLTVDGREVAREATPPGALHVDVPVPMSQSPRDVALRWAREAQVGPNDPRHAAARVDALSVRSVRAPVSVRAGRVGAASGVYADGWLHASSRFLLAGGAPGVLSVGVLSPFDHETLTIRVDDQTVTRTTVPPGTFAAAIPIARSRTARLVTLDWSRAAAISKADPRIAAALLRHLGVRPENGLRAVTRSDVQANRGTFSGLYADGWMQQDARFLIAGGRAGTMTLAAQVLVRGQQASVSIDNGAPRTYALQRGEARARILVAASSAPRLVAIHFAKVARISSADPRSSAALLEQLTLGAVATGRASSASTPTFSADLGPEHEVPAPIGTPSNASGTFRANLAGRTLHWELHVTGLSGSIVAVVLHTGAPGVVGPQLVRLCGPCGNDVKGSVPLSAAQIRELRGKDVYLNVGTARNGGGEIRGALSPSP